MVNVNDLHTENKGSIFAGATFFFFKVSDDLKIFTSWIVVKRDTRLPIDYGYNTIQLLSKLIEVMHIFMHIRSRE